MPRNKRKQRERGVEELLHTAEEVVEEQTQQRPTVFTPREDSSTRQRREHRLIPAIPPLTPASQWLNDPINPKTQNLDLEPLIRGGRIQHGSRCN